MIKYQRAEMVSIDELEKSLEDFLDQLKYGKLDKLLIFKNDRPKVVILPIEEYERMKKSTNRFYNSLSNSK